MAINKYTNKAAYSADTRPTNQSNVSLIADTNTIIDDGVNVITTLPEKGDVVGIDTEGVVRFIKLDTFNKSALAGWTWVGTVGKREGDEVLIINKANASKKWSDIYSFRLTGYTLDGTARSGVFKIYTSASATTSVTFNYNATTLADFAEQLQDFFDENCTAAEERKVVVNDDNTIDIIMLFTYYQQASNSASSGLTMTANLMPDVASLAKMRRKNGNISGEGAISSMDKALAYFRSDNSSTTYNPSSNLTSIRRGYPVCLPGYLGTSQYQSDHCAILREHYGEGEAGWKKFMADMLPIRPSLVGNMGQRNGRERTYVIAAHTFINKAGVEKPVSPAADYVANIGYDADQLRVGDWYLPTTEDLADILDGIRYSASSSLRDSDPINKALYLLGGSAVSNASNWWSCCRYSAYHAWLAYGGVGFFVSGYMCNGFGCLPVSLFRLR